MQKKFGKNTVFNNMVASAFPVSGYAAEFSGKILFSTIICY